MTVMNSDPALPPEVATPGLIRTARVTGLWYLGLAVTGLVGYALIRSKLYVADDPQATLANLVGHESLARLAVVTEMGVVLTQAMVAVWFYKLFRGVNSFAAGSITAFGLVNAVSILVSAAMLATALDVSNGKAPAPGASAADTAQLLYVVSGHLWTVGGLFFGLWLIPMGWLVRRSRWMPSLLGWILMIGGVGYVASALLTYLLPDTVTATVASLLTVPATIGELWIVGYLCIQGVRRTAGK